MTSSPDHGNKELDQKKNKDRIIDQLFSDSVTKYSQETNRPDVFLPRSLSEHPLIKSSRLLSGRCEILFASLKTSAASSLKLWIHDMVRLLFPMFSSVGDSKSD